MKKSILLLLIFMIIFSVTSAHAQSLKYKGIKTGFNIYTEYGFDFGNKLASRKGFNFGVFTVFQLKEKLSLQPELRYIQKGYKLEGLTGTDAEGNPLPDFEATYAYDYIDLPVLLSYKLNKCEKSDFNIQAGSYVSYLMNSKYKSDNVEMDIESINDIDFGLCGGVSYCFLYKAHSIFAELRTSWGLRGVDTQYKNQYKNKGFEFNIGFGF